MSAIPNGHHRFMKRWASGNSPVRPCPPCFHSRRHSALFDHFDRHADMLLRDVVAELRHAHARFHELVQPVATGVPGTATTASVPAPGGSAAAWPPPPSAEERLALLDGASLVLNAVVDAGEVPSACVPGRCPVDAVSLPCMCMPAEVPSAWVPGRCIVGALFLPCRCTSKERVLGGALFACLIDVICGMHIPDGNTLGFDAWMCSLFMCVFPVEGCQVKVFPVSVCHVKVFPVSVCQVKVFPVSVCQIEVFPVGVCQGCPPEIA
eukprot:82831-Chlamydomonas_euryale.AAC.1